MTTKSITQNDAEEYIANGGICCPFCGSDNIRRLDRKEEFSDGYAEIMRSCCEQDCKRVWKDVYRLVGVSYEEVGEDGHLRQVELLHGDCEDDDE